MSRMWRMGRIGRVIARFIRWNIQRRFSCYISPAATVGRNVYLPHPVGIVVGDGVVVGDEVTIYQGVTLGQKKCDGGYPKIGNRAILYAGAVVVGEVAVGARAIIGANAVVITNVEAEAVVAGIPARIVRRRIDDNI